MTAGVWSSYASSALAAKGMCIRQERPCSVLEQTMLKATSSSSGNVPAAHAFRCWEKNHHGRAGSPLASATTAVRVSRTQGSCRRPSNWQRRRYRASGSWPARSAWHLMPHTEQIACGGRSHIGQRLEGAQSLSIVCHRLLPFLLHITTSMYSSGRRPGAVPDGDCVALGIAQHHFTVEPGSCRDCPCRQTAVGEHCPLVLLALYCGTDPVAMCSARRSRRADKRGTVVASAPPFANEGVYSACGGP
jgi:hypothetical protein